MCLLESCLPMQGGVKYKVGLDSRKGSLASFGGIYWVLTPEMEELQLFRRSLACCSFKLQRRNVRTGQFLFPKKKP